MGEPDPEELSSLSVENTSSYDPLGDWSIRGVGIPVEIHLELSTNLARGDFPVDRDFSGDSSASEFEPVAWELD